MADTSDDRAVVPELIIVCPIVSMPETLVRGSQPHCSDELRIYRIVGEINDWSMPCAISMSIYTKSGNRNSTSDIEDCVILARFHVGQRFAV